MRLVEPKNTIKTAIIGLVFVAIVSQIILPKPAAAFIGHEMANSTPKTVDLEEETLDKAEDFIKFAFTKGVKENKTVAKRSASKVTVDGPGESVQLSLVEGQKPDKVMTAVITAYNSVPGQTDSSPFIAATGKRVHDSMIAANKLPFGTKVVIRDLFGEKVFIVEDRMNSRYGLGRMDVWMDSVLDARKFGVQRVEVEIYYPEKNTKEVAVNRNGK